MERQVRANLLQQFFVQTSIIGQSLVQREGDELIIDLEEISPYALFTSVLNALGENSLSDLARIQKIIDDCCNLFGVSRIIFRIEVNNNCFIEKDVSNHMHESWLLLSNNPCSVLPQFRNVTWHLR